LIRYQRESTAPVAPGAVWAERCEKIDAIGPRFLAAYRDPVNENKPGALNQRGLSKATSISQGVTPKLLKLKATLAVGVVIKNI